MKVPKDANKDAAIKKKANKLSEAVSLDRASKSAPLAAPPDPKVKVSVSLKAPTVPESDDHKRLRAMRKFYSKAMPVLQCSSCAFSVQCPQFRAGYECAFLPFLNSHKVQTVEDLLDYMKELVAANMRRTHLTLIMESLTGAQPSLDTSEALNLSYMQLKELHDRMTKSGETSLTIEGDSSIIGRLFGNANNLIAHTKEILKNPIVQPIETSQDNIFLDKPMIEARIPARSSASRIRAEITASPEIEIGTLK